MAKVIMSQRQMSSVSPSMMTSLARAGYEDLTGARKFMAPVEGPEALASMTESTLEFIEASIAKTIKERLLRQDPDNMHEVVAGHFDCIGGKTVYIWIEGIYAT